LQNTLAVLKYSSHYSVQGAPNCKNNISLVVLTKKTEEKKTYFCEFQRMILK